MPAQGAREGRLEGQQPVFDYTLLGTDPQSSARAGLFSTPHGEIPMPAFAPVGTQASVKAASPQELEEAGASLILSNTITSTCAPAQRRSPRWAACTGLWAGRTRS